LIEKQPQLSKHFQQRAPSAIRQAQILFASRSDRDSVGVVNLAIGNISLPMHPAMQKRMAGLAGPESPFKDGVVKYSASVGRRESQDAFLNIIASGGWDTELLRAVVTDGGSQAMELMILGVCGPSSERPLLLLDPAYSNYIDISRRCSVKTVSLRRELGADSSFTSPDIEALEAIINKDNPTALVVIPADNPTGQFLSHEDLCRMAKVCVKHGMWLIGDEAYRQLQYNDDAISTVWALTEQDVPGITGSRISIESASKVWNACGLRIGALITDNEEFHRRAVAEYTANLCSNVIGQYIFGALARQSHGELQSWYRQQRDYYKAMMEEVAAGLRNQIPGLIVSNPEAALYSVIDVKNAVDDHFHSATFVRYCAEHGSVDINGEQATLLLAPMGGFYSDAEACDHSHPARTQMRMAFVEPPEAMKRVPELFAKLLEAYSHTV
jgi:aspartate aminotransferase